jgi:hypothetical protein
MSARYLTLALLSTVSDTDTPFIRIGNLSLVSRAALPVETLVVVLAVVDSVTVVVAAAAALEEDSSTFRTYVFFLALDYDTTPLAEAFLN